MSVIVEFSLSSPRLVLHAATTAVPGVTLEIESVDVANDGGVKTVASAEGGDLDAFDQAVREDPTTTAVRLLDDLPERRLYSYRHSSQSEPTLCADWLELGAAQLDCECRDGSWQLRARFPGRDALTEFESICQSEGVEFTLHRIDGESAGDTLDPLTDAQREALCVALDVGYLDVPRTAELSAVADELSVSEQSTSERLRRATRNLAVDALPDRRQH
jgi:predicted DNA binding protein